MVAPPRVIAIDPGASAGFAYWVQGVILFAGAPPDAAHAPPADELVVEAQHAATHIYRNGQRVRVSRKSQQTLSFTAGRLLERFAAERKYQVPVADWRRALWPPASRLTKKVVLARLERDYGHLVTTTGKARADVLEAVGIAMAWARLTPEQKVKYRVE